MSNGIIVIGELCSMEQASVDVCPRIGCKADDVQSIAMLVSGIAPLTMSQYLGAAVKLPPGLILIANSRATSIVIPYTTPRHRTQMQF